MTVRELQKCLLEFNPEAVVMVGEKTEDLQGIYNIGHISFHCPKDLKDPYKADFIAILSDETGERTEVSMEVDHDA